MSGRTIACGLGVLLMLRIIELTGQRRSAERPLRQIDDVMKLVAGLAVMVSICLLASAPGLTAQAPAPLSFGVPIERAVRSGEVHEYGFMAGAGDLISGPSATSFARRATTSPIARSAAVMTMSTGVRCWPTG